MDKKQLKKIIFYITMLIYLIINVCTAHAEESSAGDYLVGFDYYTCYNLKGSSSYTSLGQYSHSNESYNESWTNKKTWTIDTSASSVGIYSIVNSYNSSNYTFTLQPVVENSNVGSSINTFKVYDMHVYYYYRPEHILTEGRIKGTFINYLPRDLMTTATIRLQARTRATQEWVTLTNQNIDGTNKTMYFDWKSTDENPSFNYDLYRLTVLYWTFSNNGYTLISNGVASSAQKICSFDFVGVETNEWEKKVDELVDLQESTLDEIKNIGDLIVNLPDLILDGVYNLFVPDDIQTIFNDKVEVLKTKMGILFLPFDFVLTELEYILDYNPKSTITLPELKVMNEPIMESTTFDIADVGSMRVSSDDDWDKVTIIEIVRFFTTLLIIYSIVHLAIDLAEALFGWYMRDVHEDISPEWIDETKDRGD